MPPRPIKTPRTFHVVIGGVIRRDAQVLSIRFVTGGSELNTAVIQIQDRGIASSFGNSRIVNLFSHQLCTIYYGGELLHLGMIVGGKLIHNDNGTAYQLVSRLDHCHMGNPQFDIKYRTSRIPQHDFPEPPEFNPIFDGRLRGNLDGFFGGRVVLKFIHPDHPRRS